LLLAATAHNLTRAVAVLAGSGHRRERGATIRRQLISLPALVASSARRLRLRLHAPTGWPWQVAFESLLASIAKIARPQPGTACRT